MFISILCILTKKVGGYVIIFSYFFLLIVQLKNWKKLGSILIALILVMFVIEPKILKSLNIAPGGKQEKYSLLFQQTARYVKTYPNDVKEDEKEVLKKVLNYDTLGKDYNPTNADPVKGYWQRGKDEDYAEYLKVWFKQGLRHPGVYIEAANAMFSGAFSFEKYITKTDMKWHDWLDRSFMLEEDTVRSKFFENTTNIIVNIYNKIYEIPIIGKILSYGFWTALIPSFIIATIFKYRKNNYKNKYFIGVIPLLLSIVLGVWLAPLTVEKGLEGMRYVYPIIYTIPLTIMWCFYCIKNNIEHEKGILDGKENSSINTML